MIDLKYILNENDYLQLNLYFFETDGFLKKNSRKVLILYFFVLIIFFAFSYTKSDEIETIGICLVAVSIFVLFYHKTSMKNHYKKMIRNNIQRQYKNRFGTKVELKITKSNLEITSIAAKTQFNFSQIKEIVETNEYYFIRLKPEDIIIPKRELAEQNLVNSQLIQLANELQITYKLDLSWKW